MATTLEEYDIGAVLGRGPTGTVRRGTRRGSPAEVAIKIVRRDLASDPHWVARLTEQRAVLERVQHPNLVPVLDLVIGEGTVTIVSELVDGIDLARVIDRDVPITTMQAARMIGEILSAVAALHAAGMVHGGLKPENVLLTSAGQVRLTDPGIASLREKSHASPARDVYSVGLLFDKLLTDDALPEKLTELLWAMLAMESKDRPSAEIARDWAAALIPELLRIDAAALICDAGATKVGAIVVPQPERGESLSAATRSAEADVVIRPLEVEPGGRELTELAKLTDVEALKTHLQECAVCREISTATTAQPAPVNSPPHHPIGRGGPADRSRKLRPVVPAAARHQ